MGAARQDRLRPIRRAPSPRADRQGDAEQMKSHARTFPTLADALYPSTGVAHRGAASAVRLYVLEGAAGLPFFSGGAAALLHLLGPTGGYLAGFPVGAFAA